MKKLLTGLTAILLISTAFATPRLDDKSQAILGEMEQKVAAMGTYRVAFEVTIDGQSVAGSYEVSGESYRVVTPEIILYCDGETKWEVHLLEREVVIDAVDPEDHTILSNPTRLFDFLDGTHTHRYVGPALINGVSCNRIELNQVDTTTANDTQNETIDAYISTATSLPVRLDYRISLLNTDAIIDVTRITPRISLDATFDYDPKRYADFEIIDFRP